ncbi:amidohydrolase [Deinococcus deserti]|uniref:amidohydrolase n=1 Tax=Deinococcus deserti TaxID=310783 RepID=UPI0002FF64BA|nr:amidohydrolase [Deinococcus deserti]
MTTSLEQVNTWAEHHLPELTKLATEIWHHAELRYEEMQSMQAQQRVLRDAGFELTTGVAGIPTAFSAQVGSHGPVVALLGEYDALSGLSQRAGVAVPDPLHPGGNGHGCGHHLLGTAALGAVLVLRDYLQASGQPGIVRYYGCPAEEGGSGKTFMVREGVFDDVSFALTWHPATTNTLFPGRSLANIQCAFHFSGIAAHASAAPHLGRSALDAVELMNIGANYLREHLPPAAKLHYAVTNTGGTSPNVVQAEAEVLYLMRAVDDQATRAVFDRVQDVARGAALMTGTRLTLKFEKACSSFQANQALSEVVSRILGQVGAPTFDDADEVFAAQIQATLPPEAIQGDRQVLRSGKSSAVFARDVIPYSAEKAQELLPGSTDVADVSWVAPTAQFMAACYALGTQAHSWQQVAQGLEPAAFKGMLQAVKVLAGTAITVLEDPELLAQIREEHATRRAEVPYVSPIPADVLPPVNRTFEGQG